MFDLITGRKEVLPDLNRARSFFTSVIHGKYIYVFGGAEGTNGGSSER